MKKIITFYKVQDCWYADLPDYIENGGDMEDLLMVSGADKWLDILCNNGLNVTLEISSTEMLQEKLLLIEEPKNLYDGAFYIANSYKDEDINHILWLCPVTLFVFKEYPKVLNYRIL